LGRSGTQGHGGAARSCAREAAPTCAREAAGRSRSSLCPPCGGPAPARPLPPAPARLRGGAAPACVRRVGVLRPRGRSDLRPRGCGAEPLRRASTGAEQGGMEVGDGGRGRRGREESWRKTRERKKDRNGTCVTSDRWVIFVTKSR